jgi:hypothetical protein
LARVEAEQGARRETASRRGGSGREETQRRNAERARLVAMDSVHATADSLEATLDQMKAVEDMRRSLRDIRYVNKLDTN